MKIKKTTYQRLKEERVKLLNDIRVMVMSPNSISDIEIRLKYRLNFQAEDAIFYGDATLKSDGIQDFITKNK